MFNFANTGAASYLLASGAAGSAGLGLIGPFAIGAGSFGVMMAGMPQPNFQVILI